ncbi:MAG: erythromycin esterase family protein [Gemmataceae bacterium]
MIERIGNAQVVALGEASHGTHEYYVWRAAITQRLIEEKGFNFIAVEGDWPDCYRVNRFIKGQPDAAEHPREALETFRRWPTWMWANEEVADSVTWMRNFNDRQPGRQRLGFYGLDVYSLWDSLYEVMGYLREHEPSAIPAARRALQCFEPYGEDAQDYARATAFVPDSCQEEVLALLSRLRSERSLNGDGADGRFVAEQNALVVKNAEAYYRSMIRSDESSWNIRDRHMAETLDRLMEHHGPNAKAIIWEHNTHIGDARYTDMAGDGMVNVGQLVREKYRESNCVLIGFASHHGTVIAGEYWDAPWEVMDVPPARDTSWEDALHRTFAGDQLLIFPPASTQNMLEWRGHRAIGVVYRPQFEQYGNYVPTVLPKRYDALLYLDETTALRPLFRPREQLLDEEIPETYPTGA